MTFKQLNERLGVGQIEADWRQHPNGGGWLYKTAQVDSTAYIGENAIVWAQVYGNAQVYGDARVSGNAQVYGDARVYGDAQVYGNAWVYGNAQVYGDAWEQSPLFIIGTRHSLTNAKHGHIQIGCHCKPFKWWKSKAAKLLAKTEGYTPAQVKEYAAYVDLFIKGGK